MKKLIATTIILSCLVMVYPVFAAQQTSRMMNRRPAMMCPQISDQKMKQLEKAMEEMRATREAMISAKNQAERKQLMEKHMAEMQSCMKMMPSFGQKMPYRHMQSRGMGRDMKSRKQVIARHRRLMKYRGLCRQMMQEIMTSMKAQMKMMNQ